MSASSTRHDSPTGEVGYPAVLDHRHYRTAAEILVAILVGAAVYFAMRQEWYDAASISVLALLGAGFLAFRDRLPSLFSLLFLIAGGVNAAGYVFNLWHQPTIFDEAVHAATSFTVMAAAGWLMLGRTRLTATGERGRFVLAVTGLGLLLGLGWELFEWIIGIIGSRHDTIVDLAMDGIGAVAAALFCAWALNRNRAG